MHLTFLLPLLPVYHRHFCEPFGGSAAVLLNRPPALLETYNDLDGEAVNFFTCLRKEPQRFLRLVRSTPYAREEFAKACLPPAALAPLERARRFFIRACQGFNALTQTTSAGQWSYARETSRRGMSAVVSRWLSGIERLPEVAERFRRVQLEHAPAIDVIRRYDAPDTLFYCDPPYPKEARQSQDTYAYEMSDEDHESLAAVLHQACGAVAISGYRCPLMDRLYCDWRRVDATPKRHRSPHGPRVESLWMNYEAGRGHRRARPHRRSGRRTGHPIQVDGAT